MHMLSKACLVAILIATIPAGQAVAAEAPSPAPEMVGVSVVMRAWPPQTGKWGTLLQNTTYDGPVCRTFTGDGQSFFGLQAKDDPYGSLNLVVWGPGDEILSSRSIKAWIDGFLLGEFLVTRRVQGRTPGTTILAAVPRSQASAWLDLFGTGGWITYSTGLKTYSASLEGADSAVKAFLGCVHEVTVLSSVGATADVEQAERHNWVEACRRAVSLAQQFGVTVKAATAASCPDIWDRRASMPQQFSELDASLKEADAALAALQGMLTFSSVGPALNPFFSTLEKLGPPPASPSPSQTNQPNPTENAAPASGELNNTLEKLRSLARQTEPPRARANPGPGSSGGSPNGTLTDALSNEQRGAIAAKVRECWPKDAGALNLDQMQAMLLVTVDGNGVARIVDIAPEDQGRLSDPRFRKFAERARRAVLDPRCSTLPVPRSLIAGGGGTLKFRFRSNE